MEDLLTYSLGAVWQWVKRGVKGVNLSITCQTAKMTQWICEPL